MNIGKNALGKHGVLLATGTVLLAVSLSACGVGGGKTESPTSSGGSTGAVSGDITGEISFQTWNLKANFQEYFEGVIASFEEEYPGTKVNWIDQPADGYADKLSADASAGTLPDVINLDAGTGYPLAQAGYLVNIGEVDSEAEELYLDAAWKALDWKAIGGNYGYPWYLNTGPALFNTALFEEAGLDPNKLPTTYTELFDQALQMAKSSGGDYAMIGNTPTIEHFGMYGVEIMNDEQTKYTFNSEKGVEFVEKYIELYQESGLLPEALSQNYTGVDQNFREGRIAYMPGSAYNIKEIQELAPNIYETLVFTEAIANAAPNMFIQSVGVSANSENQATALAFAKWVTNAENQLGFAKEVNIFPSTDGTLDDEYFTTSDGTIDGDVRVLAAKQIAEAVVYSPPTYTEAIKSRLREELALAMTGEKTAQEALDDAVTYANERISE